MARLLLIEDDRIFREMLAEALADAGHAVTQAADGRQALASTAIDLVITDLVMPGSEGLETIAALRRQRPDLPIIAISGAPVNSGLYLRLAGRLGAHRALAKPFPSTVLLRHVDELLTPPPGAPGISR